MPFASTKTTPAHRSHKTRDTRRRAVSHRLRAAFLVQSRDRPYALPHRQRLPARPQAPSQTVLQTFLGLGRPRTTLRGGARPIHEDLDCSRPFYAATERCAKRPADCGVEDASPMRRERELECQKKLPRSRLWDRSEGFARERKQKMRIR